MIESDKAMLIALLFGDHDLFKRYNCGMSPGNPHNFVFEAHFEAGARFFNVSKLKSYDVELLAKLAYKVYKYNEKQRAYGSLDWVQLALNAEKTVAYLLPGQTWDLSLEEVTWLAENISGFSMKDCVLYQDEKEIQEMIEAGIKRIDIELCNEAAACNAIRFLELLKLGANPYVNLDDDFSPYNGSTFSWVKENNMSHPGINFIGFLDAYWKNRKMKVPDFEDPMAAHYSSTNCGDLEPLPPLPHIAELKHVLLPFHPWLENDYYAEVDVDWLLYSIYQDFCSYFFVELMEKNAQHKAPNAIVPPHSPPYSDYGKKQQNKAQ